MSEKSPEMSLMESLKEPLYSQIKENFWSGDRSFWTKLPEKHYACGGTIWVRTIDVEAGQSTYDRVGGCDKCELIANLDTFEDPNLTYILSDSD